MNNNLSLDQYIKHRIKNLNIDPLDLSTTGNTRDDIKRFIDDYYEDYIKVDELKNRKLKQVTKKVCLEISIPKELIGENMHEDEKKGYAIFNDKSIPTKRYYLEKRWKEKGRKFTVLLMNPSHSDSISTDSTVLNLYLYARYHSKEDYNSIVVVNVTPAIHSDSSNLTDDLSSSDIQSNLSFIKYALNNSEDIFCGWGV